MRYEEREMGCGWGERHSIKVKILISVSVFNKFQGDCSAGSIKCMPLAKCSEGNRTTYWVEQSISLSLPFFCFYTHIKKNNNNNSFTIYFQKIVFMTPQSSQETIGVQKKQERASQERRRMEARKQDYITRS